MSEVYRKILWSSLLGCVVCLNVIWAFPEKDLKEKTRKRSTSATDETAITSASASASAENSGLPMETSLIPSRPPTEKITKTPTSGNPESADCGMGNSGSTYIGTRNVTSTGRKCQAWSSNSPHQVAGDINDDQFPDNSREEALNYCRNPQASSKSGIWCYTTDPNVEWEYCDPCPENYGNYHGCTLADKGASYIGTVDHSRSHTLCEPWTNYEISQYTFPDGSAEEAENYCRNPSPSTHLAPWCYIKAGGDIDWDYCDICSPFDGEVHVLQGFYSSHFKKTLPMNGQSCISWCITYLSCVAVIIPHNGGNECLYLTSSNRERDYISKPDRDQYEISRICVPRTEGRSAYFVNSPGRYNLKADTEEKLTPLECMDRCIANVECVMFNYYTTTEGCALCFNDTGIHVNKENAYEKLIVRCNKTQQALVYNIPRASLHTSSYNSSGDTKEGANATTITDTKETHSVLLYVSIGVFCSVAVLVAGGILLCCIRRLRKTIAQGKDAGERQALLDKTSANKPDKVSSKSAGIGPTTSRNKANLQENKLATGANATPLQTIYPTLAETPQPIKPKPVKPTPSEISQAINPPPTETVPQAINPLPTEITPQAPQAIKTAPTATPQAIKPTLTGIPQATNPLPTEITPQAPQAIETFPTATPQTIKPTTTEPSKPV